MVPRPIVHTMTGARAKTGSGNMAETCAIDFLTLVSYPIAIVLGVYLQPFQLCSWEMCGRGVFAHLKFEAIMPIPLRCIWV